MEQGRKIIPYPKRSKVGEEGSLIGFLCSRNALGLVCLVGRSFWSVWFFWMNFQSDQPDKPDRRDRPDEPAFAGRAQWKINQPPSLKRERASLE
jgi:hypothetical protein